MNNEEFYEKLKSAIMEQMPLMQMLEIEKEKAKDSVKKIINEYYHKTGLMITKIETERINTSTLCGPTTHIGDIILITEQ